MKIEKTNSQMVSDIIQHIENCKNIDNDWLVSMLRGMNLKAEVLQDYQNFDHNQALSYGRTIIYQGNSFTIYIMSWSPGDFTAIHSHGVSDWGSVVFFSDTNHRLYDAHGLTIQLVKKGIIPAGTVAPVTGNLVHAMGNQTDKPFITLHIYGSNQQISNANDSSLVYEIEKKQIRTTTGAAYINITDDLCKNTERGLLTNVETLVDYLQIVLPYYKKNHLESAIKKVEGYINDPQSYFNEKSHPAFYEQNAHVFHLSK